jgi:hypothetical protein
VAKVARVFRFGNPVAVLLMLAMKAKTYFNRITTHKV